MAFLNNEITGNGECVLTAAQWEYYMLQSVSSASLAVKQTLLNREVKAKCEVCVFLAGFLVLLTLYSSFQEAYRFNGKLF